ncbi:hypothetical protein BC939DRAFT_526040 [Gamsiella multidivaricata]|uniref:uncharacterized protein n=1 Tax=Gamsiella multidivaricata TaxID=101098 RepID=UPI002220FAA0|nr:uncharacterized protein BC939DRAFT_526040 [Gamsiella multidivaricata]KAI7829520.1 hypothetical protein BC939DRAFT_526040 [Gamsiella multidivaricata]
MDADNDTVFLIDIPACELFTSPFVLQSGPWICSISISSLGAGYGPDLAVQISHQPIAAYPHYERTIPTRLCIFAPCTEGSDSLVLETPIRDPQSLLHGIQVEIDPCMVRSFNRYIFRAILVNDNERSHQHQHQHHASPCGHFWTPCVASCLASSHVSLEAQHRLVEFLERATNSDIRLSFCARKVPSFPQRQALKNLPNCETSDNLALYAHSCILKAAGTQPMERLLNTYSPDYPFFGCTGRSNDHQHNLRSSPIREIRFEDSPPAAVEAVLSYIYFGQCPVLEPMCGYTVKDLMELATYLEVECLQNYCVDLVLGRACGMKATGTTAVRTRLSHGAEDRYDHNRIIFSRANLNKAGFHPYGPPGGTHQQNRQYASERASPCLGPRPMKSRLTKRRHTGRGGLIAPESAVQVLFGWGYRFPKLRRELVRTLIDVGYDGSVFVADAAMNMLQRFRGHAAFDGVAYELVAEQLKAQG